MRFYFVYATLFVVLFFIFWFWLPNSGTGIEKVLLVSAYSSGAIACTIGFWLLLNFKRWGAKAAKISVQNAKKVASSLWLVETPMILKDDAPVMSLRHLSFSNQSFILPVRPGHPDVELFRNLKDGDIIGFEALVEGMDCALEHELCGFLRIVSINYIKSSGEIH